MIKYLYVLVSDETDYYLEQALLSITSLKMRMPYAFVSLLIDDSTEKTLMEKRKNILELVSEVKVVEIETQFSKKARSRWLKTSMRRYISGDFLFIDCDTVICEDLSDIEKNDIMLGAVLDRHVLISDSSFKEDIQNNDKILKFNASLVSDKHFNSGVIFCRDNPLCYTFYEEWHKLWLRGSSKKIIDQPSFNQANLNFNNIITEMNGIWNCQIIQGGLIFLFDAKIIHIFTHSQNNGPYTLTDPFFLQKIKEAGIINSEVKSLLLYPKINFHKSTYIIADKKTIDIIISRMFPVVKKIYFWKCIELILKIYIKISKVKGKLKFKKKQKSKSCNFNTSLI